jgi:hypothetical protein
MRPFLVFFIFCTTLVFAQKPKKNAKETDSVAYYIELSNFNIKTNNYKFSLGFAQKAIDYAEKTKDVQNQAFANYTLGRFISSLRNTTTR